LKPQRIEKTSQASVLAYCDWKWQKPRWWEVVSCRARARLLTRNGLVNKVEFLGLITQK